MATLPRTPSLPLAPEGNNESLRGCRSALYGIQNAPPCRVRDVPPMRDVPCPETVGWSQQRWSSGTIHVMGRHGRTGVIFSGVVKHRLVVGFVALGALGMLVSAWSHRADREGGLLWLGMGVFTASATIIVGSLSIGPRPLRSFGVGAWLLVMAGGALMVWLGRDAFDSTKPRHVVVPPFMLFLAIVLVPLALWMMIWRPEQNWEKELRYERERDQLDSDAR